jgi:hypothetical protein
VSKIFASSYRPDRLGADPAPYPIGKGGGAKRQGHEADHSPQTILPFIKLFIEPFVCYFLLLVQECSVEWKDD